MPPDGPAEIAALRRCVGRVEGGVGWAELPQAAAAAVFARLQSAMLDRLAECNPDAPGWFSRQAPATLQIGRLLTAHAGGVPGVPLGMQQAPQAGAARHAFASAFPDCRPAPRMHLFPPAQLGRHATGWPRVFGTATSPGDGIGAASTAWFQLDMITMISWTRDTQLVLGPDDRVCYVVKPEGETVLKRLLLQDAVDRGYVLLDLRAAVAPLPAWARLTPVR